MKGWQKGIKYGAIALAVLLCLGILDGAMKVISHVPGISGQRQGSISDTMQTYPITGEVRSLKIELSAAELTVQEGEVLSVSSNLSGLSVKNDKGTLKIEEKDSWFSDKNQAQVLLTIPESTVFDQVNLDAGAGVVRLESLEAGKVNLDLGAGKVEIARLNASEEAEIDGGAGALTISAGQIRNLDLDMGVGKMVLTAQLTGKNRLNMGVGAGEITLLGQAQDYRFEVDKDLGEITIDGTSMSDRTIWGSGDTTVQVDGGVGSVRIQFRQG